MSKQSVTMKYYNYEFCIIGLTVFGNIFVGNASYFNKKYSSIICKKKATFMVDDLDELLRQVKDGTIDENQLLNWLDESPHTIHAN